MYQGKLASVTHRDKNRNGDPVNDLEIVVDVGSEYARMWTYVPASSDAPNAWKLRELLDAVSLPPKGSFDPKALEGKQVNVKVAADTDLNGNYRGKVKNLLKPGKADQDGASGDEGETEYSEWDDDDIKAEIEERGLKLSGRWTRDKAIDLLVEDDGGGEAEADEDGEATDEYDNWPLDDLKAEAEERGILGNISGRKTKDKYIAALRADDAGPAAEGDEEGAPEDDYDEWELDELKEEVKDRKLEVKGRASKEKLIEVLRADDKDEPF